MEPFGFHDAGARCGHRVLYPVPQTQRYGPLATRPGEDRDCDKLLETLQKSIQLLHFSEEIEITECDRRGTPAGHRIVTCSASGFVTDRAIGNGKRPFREGN